MYVHILTSKLPVDSFCSSGAFYIVVNIYIYIDMFTYLFLTPRIIPILHFSAICAIQSLSLPDCLGWGKYSRCAYTYCHPFKKLPIGQRCTFLN